MCSKTTELDTLVLIECSLLKNTHNHRIQPMKCQWMAGPLSKAETSLVIFMDYVWFFKLSFSFNVDGVERRPSTC